MVDSEAILEALQAEPSPANKTLLEDALSDAVIDAAACMFRHVLRQLPADSSGSVALQRVLLGADGESIRKAAERAGVSHVAMLKAETKLRQYLKGVTARG